MLGVINLDKPVGPTSHDMVMLVRRVMRIRRIGHGGTLDPLASGVLPILVGGATRFSAELTGGSKRYDATFRIGARSATDDAQGPLEPVDAPLPDDGQIRTALRGMVGRRLQRPPAFSARKVGGRSAHRAARAGEPLALESREIVIDALDVLAIRPGEGVLDVEVDVRCGAGTYVRSIARDLGEMLGSGGYLLALRRTEAAGLRVTDAVTPEALEGAAAEERLAHVLIPIETLLRLPRLDLPAPAAWRFVHGSWQDLDPSAGAEGATAAVFGEGRFLGTGAVEGGVLRPEKVLPTDGGRDE